MGATGFFSSGFAAGATAGFVFLSMWLQQA
jgi:hypothetical protein